MNYADPQQPHSPHHVPTPARLAVVTGNTLTAIGMSQLLTGAMPAAEVDIFQNYAELCAAGAKQFVHYFISPEVLLQAPEFFGRMSHRTILLTSNDDSAMLPTAFHRINPTLPRQQLIEAFVHLMQSAHSHGRNLPDGIRQQDKSTQASLTPRERQVLRLVAQGLLNKQIADHLGISLNTVISHRKNLSERLGIKSVAGLTIYAATHGIIGIDEV